MLKFFYNYYSNDTTLNQVSNRQSALFGMATWRTL